ncbi:MAG: DUF1153 domain-containing protein [Thalassospira sp.]|nr:DUF1153 domain-containing protein [Thalassospira sp.]
MAVQSKRIKVTDLTLPEKVSGRWLKRNKQQVVNAVLWGAISLREACRQYQLSVDEFLRWRASFATTKQTNSLAD